MLSSCCREPRFNVSAVSAQATLERATEAHHVGDPTELDEAAAIEWIPLDDIPGLIRSGHVNDGFTLTPLLAELAGL